MQTQQRQAWRLFQHSNVVSFVVSASLAAVLAGLPTFGSTQQGESTGLRTVHAAQANGICPDPGPDPNWQQVRNDPPIETTVQKEASTVIDFSNTAIATPRASARRCEHAGLVPMPSVPHQKQASAMSAVKTKLSDGTGTKKPAKSVSKKSPAKTSSRVEKKHTTKSSKKPTKMKPAKKSRAARPGNYTFSPPVGGNAYPFGQCTWWANQRYHQIHGKFVPWRVNANAAQWVDRAREAGWRISGKPRVGSIIVLQPWVQGAWGAGHVGMVEHLRPDGSVIASSMNWGYQPAVIESKYRPGSGVAFIYRA